MSGAPIDFEGSEWDIHHETGYLLYDPVYDWFVCLGQSHDGKEMIPDYEEDASKAERFDKEHFEHVYYQGANVKERKMLSAFIVVPYIEQGHTLKTDFEKTLTILDVIEG